MAAAAAGTRCRVRTGRRPIRRPSRTSSATSCSRPGRRQGCRSAGTTVAACRPVRRRTSVATPRRLPRRPRPLLRPRMTRRTTTWWWCTASSWCTTTARTGDGDRRPAARPNCCTASRRWCICWPGRRHQRHCRHRRHHRLNRHRNSRWPRATRTGGRSAVCDRRRP